MVKFLWNFVSIWPISWVRSTSGYVAAFFDVWLPVSSSSVCNSSIKKLDPENVDIAVGILSPISSRSWGICTYGSAAAIWDFWLPVSSSRTRNSFVEKLDHENRGVAVGISSVSSVSRHMPGGINPQAAGMCGKNSTAGTRVNWRRSAATPFVIKGLLPEVICIVTSHVQWSLPRGLQFEQNVENIQFHG